VTGARELSLEELAESAGMTPRNVRAYQARGLLPPPSRDGRSARYGAEHVARLRLVRALHQRGLSLRVIRDIVDRGDAEAELARLSREQLVATWGPEAMVPLLSTNVAAFEAVTPGRLDRMAEAGILVRDGERYLASTTGLGLTSALLSHGIPLETSAALCEMAADAADGVAEELRRSLAEASPDRDDVHGLAIQLAATAFSDVLARRLGLDGAGPPKGDPTPGAS